ncbi:MAG: response regulator transcription factor [Bacteroidales bacterium]|nr:response regulator transcription factor [Bacteroidales bacterium]
MLKCIAIDDEPLALKQIVRYIDQTGFLELSGQFDNALDAISFLHQNEVDLMFVDIQMPDLSGMDFVKSLHQPPLVIFTTAYSEYAFEGFRVDAVDFLLKPIAFPDFLQAAEKAAERFRMLAGTPHAVQKNDQFLFLKSEYKLLRINFKSIKYIESMREYIRIHLDNEPPIMTLMSLKKIEEFLPAKKFMRVHRSYIVNTDKIMTVERNRIVFDGKTYIPVSEQYRVAFQQYLNNNFLP